MTGVASRRGSPPAATPRPVPGTKAARRLILLPIIHTEADMGALAASVRRATVAKLGRTGWRRNVEAIARMWTHIRQTVEALEVPWEKVRLYQDGLPECGREAAIVSELAAAGSANHQLLLALMEKGARLVGTESPELLLEEYRLVRHVLDAKNEPERARIEAQEAPKSRALLARRDRHIASRIGESLRGGETGILFLGMLHSVEPHLARDIRVTYPIQGPPRAGRREP